MLRVHGGFLALILLIFLVLTARTPAEQLIRQVPCTEIISFQNRLVRLVPEKSRNAVYIATKLGVDARWVERCMVSYGRRPDVTAHAGSEDQDQLEEAWESGEPEEPAREELRGYVAEQPTLMPQPHRKFTPKVPRRDQDRWHDPWQRDQR